MATGNATLRGLLLVGVLLGAQSQPLADDSAQREQVITIGTIV
jgi:hypothetical protein